MKHIQLTKDSFAIVDDHDFELLSKHKWYSNSCMGKLYATRGRGILMHRLIMNFPKNSVDHINGDTLDNRRENLRIATHQQNMMNRKLNKNNKTGFKGVYQDKSRPNFRAQIRFGNLKIHLGVFTTAIEAARVYDKKARELFGEFAKPNFI